MTSAQFREDNLVMCLQTPLKPWRTPPPRHAQAAFRRSHQNSESSPSEFHSPGWRGLSAKPPHSPSPSAQARPRLQERGSHPPSDLGPSPRGSGREGGRTGCTLGSAQALEPVFGSSVLSGGAPSLCAVGLPSVPEESHGGNGFFSRPGSGAPADGQPPAPPHLTPGAQCEACAGAPHPPARLRDRHQGPMLVLPCPHPCLPHLAPPPVIRAKRSPSPGRGQQPFPASLLGFFITYKTFWTGEPWTRRSRQEGQEPACQVPQASPRQCHVLSPSDVSASCRPSRSDAGLSPLCPETPHACWPHTSGTGQQGLAAGPAKAWGGV